MGSMIQEHELSLQCRPTYVPRTVSEFLGQVSMIGNVSERMIKLDEYITRLEDEMRKIDAFKRELPLCMLLLRDAIVTVKEEAMLCTKSNAEPVLEEFIPLKISTDDEDDDNKVETRKENDSREKMNWLSSVQLWNSSSDHQYSNLDLSINNNKNKRSLRTGIDKGTEEEVNHLVSNTPFKSLKGQSMGLAFVPFSGYTSFPVSTAVSKEVKEEFSGLPRLSLQTPGTNNSRDDSSGLRSKTSGGRTTASSASIGETTVRSGSQPQQQSTRKQRRCWSPELHRRFVDALQQLGGTQVATPKQIRELMQVDGLTNDEVKSHLQKYRLHMRRTPPTPAPAGNRFAVSLGGLWPPQDQYGESSKQSNSQSGSPQGPLQFGGTSRATSMTGGDSMEDEDDEKSDSHSWRSRVHSSEKNHV